MVPTKEAGFGKHDKQGRTTLEVIAGADRFNAWMFHTIRPHCSGKILEIGSGIGNISQYLFQSGTGDSIVLSDIREDYCLYLQQKFGNEDTLEGILQIDLTDPLFEDKFSGYREHFDTVFALNVVEHIRDDSLAIQNARFLLKEGGHLIILVPSYPLLYCRFDQELGHYRRYTLNRLKLLLQNNEFEIIHSQHFNMMGIAGWFVSGKILRKRTIPKGQMGLYNRLVPVFKIMDRITGHKVGLSVIVVGVK